MIKEALKDEVKGPQNNMAMHKLMSSNFNQNMFSILSQIPSNVDFFVVLNTKITSVNILRKVLRKEWIIAKISECLINGILRVFFLQL